MDARPDSKDRDDTQTFGGAPFASYTLHFGWLEEDLECVSISEDLAISKTLEVSFEPERPDEPTFSMTVDYSTGAPKCLTLTFHSRGKGITGTDTRKIPIEMALREMTVHSQFPFTRDRELARQHSRQGSRPVPIIVDNRPAYGIRDAIPWDRIAKERDSFTSRARSAGKGIPIDDEELERIAARFRELTKTGVRSPAKTLKDELHVSLATVQRWLRMAREKGILEHSNRSRRN